MERVIEEFPDAIIDTGAGHAHYEDADRLARLEAAMAKAGHVVLVLPDADPERCTEICDARDRERLGSHYDESRLEVNGRFVRSEGFQRVATHTLIAGQRTADELVDALMAVLD